MTARILLIEDNPANLDLMRYLLQAYGYTPLTAGDGEEGLEAAHRERPDLIVCDIQLPKRSGYEVAQQLKGHPDLGRVPLVAITAFAMVGDREKVLAAGFDGYLSKPIEPETFVAQVEAFLPVGRRQAATPRTSEAAAIREPAPAPPARHASILVVDNSPANLALMRCLLEPFGYRVTTAGDGAEALAQVLQAAPDLILSDLHMPRKDGLAFIREMRADSSCAPSSRRRC
jgi:two-component system cell cycle response regulator